jgi:CRISPR-associated protein Cmr3
MWLFIQSNDTLFFRAGRPFEAGTDVWIETVFPPFPHTVYGMLRTLIAHKALTRPDYDDLLSGIKDDSYKKLLGTKDSIGTLSIQGPLLGHEWGGSVEIFLPLPQDLFLLSGKKRDTHYLLQPKKNNQDLSAFSDMSCQLKPLSFAKDVEDSAFLEPVSDMLSGPSLITYLKGECNSNTSYIRRHLRFERFLTEESSAIIARDDNLSAREGYLARPRHVRLQDGLSFENKGLLIRLVGLNDDQKKYLEKYFNTSQIAQLGGEGRTVSVNIGKPDLPKNRIDEMVNQIVDTGRFRTVLTSPGYFPKTGFLPDFIGDNLEGDWEIDGKKRCVRLVSVVSGSARAIGGWDLARKRPRKVVKTVPAGSVFFFKIVNYEKKNDGEWLTMLVQSSLPGTLPGGDEDYQKKGFNTFFIGGWDYVS